MNSQGVLSIVATPIGNLKDITLRALETLKGADLILAEDTRVIQKLLAHYEIKKPFWRFDEHAVERSYEEIEKRLKQGEKIAFVSDAGTPNIADPGAKLVGFIKINLPQVRIEAIPGSSALTAVLSVSGLNANQFTFVGYPPHKKGRVKFFFGLKGIAARPVVLYESPHRLTKTLAALQDIFGESHEIVVAKELTKVHEEVFRGSLAIAAKYFVGEKGKGEFVIIVP